MKKKGVSPVIATVLLVGMVIALALIVFIWMRSFSQETITKFEDENIELACGRVNLIAEDLGSKISFSNIGDIAIYDVRVKVSDAGGQDTEEMRSFGWPSIGLNPGDSTQVSYTPGDTTTVTPILLGNSDDGKKTYACTKQEFEI